MVLIIENKRKEGKNTNIIKFKVQSMIHLYFFSKKKKFLPAFFDIWRFQIYLTRKKKEKKKFHLQSKSLKIQLQSQT